MNNKQSHINDDLLVKHLLGEATAEEQEEVATWISESDANRKHYKQFKQIWDNSKKLAAKSTIDENDAWKRFQQKVSDNETNNSKTIPLSAPRKNNWMRIAATLVFLIGCAWLLQYNYYNATTTYIAEGTVVTETLPDGTTVTLNKGAQVKFNSRFTGDTRSVKLTGEAFFDVTPNKEKPFIISAGNAEIKVVGTSFNVKSSDERTEVIVETGIVEVSKKQHMVKLQPKEMATVLKSKSEPLKEAVDDALYNYYRTKELVCNNTPLWRLVDVLNDAYNVNITIENIALKDRPITTTFKDQPLENILDVIAKTLDVRIEQHGKNITIK